eukprot:4317773-Amphidinium_carterae.1
MDDGVLIDDDLAELILSNSHEDTRILMIAERAEQLCKRHQIAHQADSSLPNKYRRFLKSAQ